MQEIQTELQHYFLKLGYDFQFVDFTLNYEFDPFIDPFLFEYLKNELNESFELSEGCFFLALLGNKYGTAPLPLEISQDDYDIIKTTSLSSNLGKVILFILKFIYKSESLIFFYIFYI